MIKPTIFIGIDQTGATDKNGNPKPLDVCLIDNRKALRIIPNLKIKSLQKNDINKLISENLSSFKNEKVFICVDSAIGLPQSTQINYKKIFKLAKKFSHENKKYGALVAYYFFQSFINNSSIAVNPRRTVDVLVNANSVFNLMPFQKNIGCGTYRIIKDLSEDKKWFDLWPFEKCENQFIIAEGYPSYFWKNILNLNKRNLIDLKNIFSDLEFKNMNQADSFVLAYGSIKSIDQILLNPPKIAGDEGWIFGVPYE